jgi:thioredoxin reductase
MDETEVFDITIVGGGPSGLFATFYAGLRQMKTKLIEALEELGGQVAVLYPEKYLYDIPGFSRVTGKDLVANLVEQAKRFNPTIVMGDRVMKIRKLDGGILELETLSGMKHYSRNVLITVGAGAFYPNKLEVPGGKRYEGIGVYYSLKDKSIMKGKDVLIVGGGDSAVDWAINLNGFARHVTLIHRSDHFRALEENVSEVMRSGVTVKTFHELKEVLGDGNQVTGAVMVDNRTDKLAPIDVDAILVNIGFRLDLGPVKGWGLEVDGRDIIADGEMETNIRGVFVAGDIARPSKAIKLNIIASGFAQAAVAVNVAKSRVDPTARTMPGHSSDLKISV